MFPDRRIDSAECKAKVVLTEKVDSDKPAR